MPSTATTTPTTSTTTRTTMTSAQPPTPATAPAPAPAPAPTTVQTTEPTTQRLDLADRSVSTTADRLTAEWRRLRRQPGACRAATVWAIVPGEIADLDQVLDALGRTNPSQPTPTSHAPPDPPRPTGITPSSDARHDAEQRFRRLIAIARDDDLAARVIIQRILPGLLAVAGRRRRQHRAATDAIDELLGAAWLAIRSFDPERTPACLAAALITDADYRVFRAPFRRRTPIPVDPDELPARQLAAGSIPADHAMVELASIVADARQAGVASVDLELVRRLVATDSTEDVARDLGVSARTIRNRRARVAGQLRDIALVA